MKKLLKEIIAKASQLSEMEKELEELRKFEATDKAIVDFVEDEIINIEAQSFNNTVN